MGINVKKPSFLENTNGGIAVTFAIAIIPVMMSVGVVVDYSALYSLKAKVANSADAALLAAANSVLNAGLISGDENPGTKERAAIMAKLESEFSDFFEANMYADSRHRFHGHILQYDPKTGSVNVTLKYDYKPVFGGVLSQEKVALNVASATQMKLTEGGAISMYLVLDQSGSMNGSKMKSLKEAVASMATQFEKLDSKHKYVRVGAVAYSSQAAKAVKLKWGSASANNYVQSLYASGGTSSTKAVAIAKNKLQNSSETVAHEKSSGQEPSLIMVFMTDGNNNKVDDDTKTKKNCNKAKKKNIEIFTVAFKAPARGQQLLKYCASTIDHYFDANNSEDLIDAFRKIGSAAAGKLILTQ